MHIIIFSIFSLLPPPPPLPPLPPSTPLRHTHIHTEASTHAHMPALLPTSTHLQTLNNTDNLRKIVKIHPEGASLTIYTTFLYYTFVDMNASHTTALWPRARGKIVMYITNRNQATTKSHVQLFFDFLWPLSLSLSLHHPLLFSSSQRS